MYVLLDLLVTIVKPVAHQVTMVMAAQHNAHVYQQLILLVMQSQEPVSARFVQFIVEINSRSSRLSSKVFK